MEGHFHILLGPDGEQGVCVEQESFDQVNYKKIFTSSYDWNDLWIE